MQDEEPLFEYIEKMKKVAEIFAMDHSLLTSQNTTLFIDDEAVKRTGRISLREVNNADTLEESYYNELGSIKRIIEFINAGDYEVYDARGWDRMEEIGIFDLAMKWEDEENEEGYYEFENEEDYDELESEENEDDYVDFEEELNQKESHMTSEIQKEKQYKDIMKKFRGIINKMVLQLYVGLKVMVQQCGIEVLEEGDNSIEVNEETYLTYDTNNKCFNMIKDGKVLLENVEVESAMALTADYLYITDMQQKAMENLTGRKQSISLSYNGWNVSTGDRSEGQEER